MIPVGKLGRCTKTADPSELNAAEGKISQERVNISAPGEDEGQEPAIRLILLLFLYAGCSSSSPASCLSPPALSLEDLILICCSSPHSTPPPPPGVYLGRSPPRHRPLPRQDPFMSDVIPAVPTVRARLLHHEKPQFQL